MNDGHNEDTNINSSLMIAEKKYLYSCGDGQVMMHSDHKEEKTIDIETIIAKTNDFSRKPPSRSDVLFQPNENSYSKAQTRTRLTRSRPNGVC